MAFGHLKSQFVMSSGGHGGRRKRPLVFTEQGIAMLSGVLRTDRAIAVNIEIMRAFVELRREAAVRRGRPPVMLSPPPASSRCPPVLFRALPAGRPAGFLASG